MTTNTDNNKTIAAVIAFGFHGLLALLFFLVVFKTPIPPFPEASTPGIEINFGTSDDGMGDVQPEDNSNTENVSSPTSENISKTTNNEAKAEPKNYVTQNTEEAPVIEKNPTKTTENTSENNTAKENTNSQPTVNASALYKGKTKNNSTDTKYILITKNTNYSNLILGSELFNIENFYQKKHKIYNRNLLNYNLINYYYILFSIKKNN